jgi:hypothetical protein
VVHVEQLRFEWGSSQSDSNQVVIDRETSEAAVALMTRALIAVVRAVREANDER